MGRYWGGRAETHIWAKPSPRTPPQLFFIVTGFTHSLGQVAKITGFMMKKEGKKFRPLKAILYVTMFLPVLGLASYSLGPNWHFEIKGRVLTGAGIR